MCVYAQMCVHAGMHLSMHRQRVGKRASSTKSIVCSQLQIASIIPVLRHGQSLREESQLGDELTTYKYAGEIY